MTKSATLLKAIILIFISLLQNSFQASSSYQWIYSVIPFPRAKALFTTAAVGKYEVIVTGATEYHHIVVQGSFAGKSKSDTSLYKPDSYTSPTAFTGLVLNFVYIVSAPGLVKVQLAIFGDNIKQGQKFFIASQFDRGYLFFQFFSNKACQLNVTLSGETNFNLFQNKEDAFSTDLFDYTFSTSLLSLPNAGTYYIRVRFNTSLDISNTLGKTIKLYTFSQSPCQSPCPFGETVTDFLTVYPTTKDFCQCYNMGYFFNPATRTCSQCLPGNTNSYCLQMHPQICKNGIKQGSEQCDNEGQAGCTNCMIEFGYICTQNQANLSNCTQSYNPAPSTVDSINNEVGLTIESRNKIIIGVCVGVGSAIIVGLGIFLLVKYLAAKKAIAVSQNVTQMKALDGKGSEAIVL